MPTPYATGRDWTLYHGDCLEILPGLEAGSIDAVVTDPPYGIAWHKSENKARKSRAHAGIANDDNVAARDAALELCAGIPAVVFGSFYAPFPDDLRQVLVWHKPADAGVVGSTTGFRRDAEPIFLVGPWPRQDVRWSSVVRSYRAGIAAIAAETGHPHTKPVDVIEGLIASMPGNAILDPFTGSGTTGVACLKTGRKFIGIEIDEGYCEIAAKRLRHAEEDTALFAEAEERCSD